METLKKIFTQRPWPRETNKEEQHESLKSKLDELSDRNKILIAFLTHSIEPNTGGGIGRIRFRDNDVSNLLDGEREV